MAFWEKWAKREQEDTVDTIKCPFCGAIIAASETDCPACGRVIRISYAQGKAKEVYDDIDTESEPVFGGSSHRQSTAYDSIENHFEYVQGKTAFCYNCGAKLNENAKFCHVCGTSCEQEQTDGNNRRRTVYDGIIHKCPNCGEILASFQAHCPACGYEIRGSYASSTVKELSDKLEAIDLQPEPKLRGFSRRQPDSNELSEKDKRKIDLIRNFPIPNTREDLLEFLILAYSNIDYEHIEGWDSISKSQIATSEAWNAKYEQAYQKAVISFGNLEEFQKINDMYTQRKEKREQAKLAHDRRQRTLLVGILAFLIVITIFTWVVAFIL